MVGTAPENTSLERAVEFTEDVVSDWCERSGDPNPIHLDEEEAGESMFGERIVPGMMLLDQLSGMLTNMGGDGQTIILAGTTARFRDPVYFNETITFTVELADESAKFAILEFEARSNQREVLVAHGTASIVVKE